MAACSLLSVAIPALAQGVAYRITTCTVGARPDGGAVADVNGELLINRGLKHRE